jgi:hypothetical protein
MAFVNSTTAPFEAQYDGAAAAFPHQRNRAFGHEKNRFEVHGNDAIPLILGRVHHICTPDNTGVVHEYIESAAIDPGALHGPLAGVRHRNIAAHERCVPAVPADGLDCRRAILLVQINTNDKCSL